MGGKGIPGRAVLIRPSRSNTQDTNGTERDTSHVLSNIQSETAQVERDVDVVLDRAILQRGDEDRGVAWPAGALESIAAGAGVREVARATANIDSPRAYRSSTSLRIVRVDGVWEVAGIDFTSVSE